MHNIKKAIKAALWLKNIGGRGTKKLTLTKSGKGKALSAENKARKLLCHGSVA